MTGVLGGVVGVTAVGSCFLEFTSHCFTSLIDAQARIIHHLGTETDIPRMTGDKILGNDQEAPTPITTGEGITAGTIGMIDTPGAIQGKEIDPKTQDTDSRAIPTVTKAEDSDSSRLGIDEACPQRSTSSR